MMDEEILHYGVKGMKWRKRLARSIQKSANKDRAAKNKIVSDRNNRIKLAEQKSKMRADRYKRLNDEGRYSGNAYRNTQDADDRDRIHATFGSEKERDKEKRLKKRIKIKEKLAKIIGG